MESFPTCAEGGVFFWICETWNPGSSVRKFVACSSEEEET